MVGSGGFEPHGSMMPDHDADADRRLRQRDIRNLGRHIIAMVALVALALAFLGLLSLAAGIL